jgi:hypothetical protein
VDVGSGEGRGEGVGGVGGCVEGGGGAGCQGDLFGERLEVIREVRLDGQLQ